MEIKKESFNKDVVTVSLENDDTAEAIREFVLDRLGFDLAAKNITVEIEGELQVASWL